MPVAKPKNIKFRSGFPYFIKSLPTDFLIKANKLPVSDIWGLWHYIIHSVKKKYGRRFDLQFLESLLEQAQYFFEAAASAPIKSQPLLYYYSFLNLTKAFLNIEINGISHDNDFFHGIEPCDVSSTLNLQSAYVVIKSFVSNPPNIENSISVAYQLSQTLGDNYKKILAPPPNYDNGPWKFNIQSLLLSCIGIHRTVSETYNTNENFVYLESPEIWKYGRTLIWKTLIETNKKQRQNLINAGYSLTFENGYWLWKESIPLTSDNISKTNLINLNNILNNKGMWSYCTRDGYRFYISPFSFCKDLDGVYKYKARVAGNNSIQLSSLSIIYFLMFFFGSITRYHPYLFEKILSNKEIWVVNEFLKTQPKQFLHLLTSKVLSKPVLFTKMPN